MRTLDWLVEKSELVIFRIIVTLGVARDDFSEENMFLIQWKSSNAQKKATRFNVLFEDESVLAFKARVLAAKWRREQVPFPYQLSIDYSMYFSAGIVMY